MSKEKELLKALRDVKVCLDTRWNYETKIKKIEEIVSEVLKDDNPWKE